MSIFLKHRHCKKCAYFHENEEGVTTCRLNPPQAFEASKEYSERTGFKTKVGFVYTNPFWSCGQWTEDSKETQNGQHKILKPNPQSSK